MASFLCTHKYQISHRVLFHTYWAAPVGREVVHCKEEVKQEVESKAIGDAQDRPRRGRVSLIADQADQKAGVRGAVLLIFISGSLERLPIVVDLFEKVSMRV